MKPLLPFAVIAIFFSFAQLSAQNPSDCVGAIPICLEGYSEANSFIGIGDVENEVNSVNSCFGTSPVTSQVEVNSVWYTFTTQQSGDLCVLITPNDPFDDYDYGIYNLTDASCEDIFNDASLEVSCNFSGSIDCGGVTGPTGGGPIPCPAQEPCLAVVEGETYAILITNYSASVNGYDIDFSTSTAQIFDDVPPEIENVSSSPEAVVEPECGQTSLVLNFSENISCASFVVDSIFLIGPGVTHDIISMTAKDCDLGGIFDNQYSLVFDPALLPGNYFLSIASNDDTAPTVLDACSNPIDNSDPANLQIAFNVAAPIFEGTAQPQDACLGDDVALNLAGFNLTSSYTWYSPNGVDAANEMGTGTSISFNTGSMGFVEGANTVYVTDQKPGGCTTDPYEVTVNLLGPPIPDFSYNIDCSTGMVSFTNNTLDPNPQLGAISYSWGFGDPFLSGSSQENSSFTYSDPGSYTVSLAASYGANCAEATATQDIVIPVFPVAAFDAPIGDCAPHTITLVSTGEGETFSWDFGDGSAPVSGETVTHEYTAAGDYTITLNVSSTPDDCTVALTDETTQMVQISGVPIIESITSDAAEETFVFQEVNFTANILDDVSIGTYSWDFGDGTVSSDETGQVAYELVGTYEVCATVFSAVGNCESAPSCTSINTATNAWIDVPSAFSPNGDDINDLLEVEGNGVESFDFRVYNRWGEEVFRSTDLGIAWDGTWRGKAQEVDVFIYSLEATLVGGVPSNKEGKISLLR